MENHDDYVNETEFTSKSGKAPEVEDWANYRDDDVMQQQSAIRAVEAEKIPFVGDKEPLTSLTAEYQSGSPILLEKIKVLSEQFDAIRRMRGDGNCFFRAFMFSYLEHILVSQDQAEVDRIKAKVEECRSTLRSLGYSDFTFEDFFELFLEQLDAVLQGNEAAISSDDLVKRSRDQSVSDYVEQFCKASVEPMGEESDHVHITALSDALGVAIRVEYLDRSFSENSGINVNHHDFIPKTNIKPSEEGDGDNDAPPVKPFITLLYRPGHYDVLYSK